MFNTIILKAANCILTILDLVLIKSCRQKWSLKTSKGEMLFIPLPTTLLQIFCIIIFNSQVVGNSFIDPDDNLYMNSLIIELPRSFELNRQHI